MSIVNCEKVKVIFFYINNTKNLVESTIGDWSLAISPGSVALPTWLLMADWLSEAPEQGLDLLVVNWIETELF